MLRFDMKDWRAGCETHDSLKYVDIQLCSLVQDLGQS